MKIMIGGGQMDDEIKKYVKADAYGKDAIAAVNLCKEWLGLKVLCRLQIGRALGTNE